MDEALTGRMRAAMPFAAALGIEVLEANDDGVEATATWSEERTTKNGVLHGGFLMAVADSVGAMAAVTHLPAGATTATIESKTNFMRAVRSGRVTIRSAPVHVGTRIIVVQTDIRRDDGELVSRTIQTQAVITS